MTTATSDPRTISDLLAATVAARGEQSALGWIVDGTLTWCTWRELAAAVDGWAGALSALGVAPGDRVVQFSPNCREWILTDLALQQIGAVHVPLHAALSVEQVAELANHAGAKVVLLREGGDALADRIAPGTRLVRHAELLKASGGRQPPAVRDQTVGGPAMPSPALPDALATILYTSGTTGPPLGVMLSHRNLVTNAIAMTIAAAPPGDELRFCLLPLSHIYARTCDLYSWLVHGGRMVLAESRETIFRDVKLVAPTAINAVPYFYQKVVDRLRDAGGEVDAARLRDALGGRVRRLYSGGAPLPPEVDRFFAERGLTILCGYGLTESAPVITATLAGEYRSGTVGKPIEGVEVRLADDGEVLTRGPHVMQGYWRDAAATARVIRDGWLYTGDLGQWDEAGHLRIVGRKKEMIVLATGKKVAPTRVEQLLAGSPWIEQACVVGDGRKCLGALVVPNGEALRKEVKRRRLWVWSKRRAVTHPQVVALYREEIDRCLAGLADFEQVGPFRLLDRAFSLELGETTPKLSLCRTVIQRHFTKEIDAMYRGAEGRVVRR
jgi:long-chain acyl-CoA synthetase